MESGKIFGSDEDSRRSCESGWTMYLASPSHDHDGYNCYYDHDDDDEEDSDGGESMESDASSGPMEATSCLKLHKEVEDQKSASKKKKKKSDEEMVSVETTTRVLHNINHDNDDDDDNDDDGDNHVYDYGNDNYSAVHSYVGSVRHERVSLI